MYKFDLDNIINGKKVTKKIKKVKMSKYFSNVKKDKVLPKKPEDPLIKQIREDKFKSLNLQEKYGQ